MHHIGVPYRTIWRCDSKPAFFSNCLVKSVELDLKRLLSGWS